MVSLDSLGRETKAERFFDLLAFTAAETYDFLVDLDTGRGLIHLGGHATECSTPDIIRIAGERLRHRAGTPHPKIDQSPLG